MVGRAPNCPLPKIQVMNPVTHHTWDEGRYTTYDICIQTQHKAFSLSKSTTRRRFSEFMWLKKQLKAHHPARSVPSLPPKKFFIQRFDDAFIEKRREGLEQFLNSVIQEIMYLSDTTMHLFLQTDLTMKEIEDFINGKTSEDFILRLWQDGGKKNIQSCASPSMSPTRFSLSSSDPDDSSLQSEGLSVSLLSTESAMSLGQDDPQAEECDRLSLRDPKINGGSDTSVLSSSCFDSEENSLSKGDNSEDSENKDDSAEVFQEPSQPEFLRANSRDFRPSSCFSINQDEELLSDN